MADLGKVRGQGIYVFVREADSGARFLATSLQFPQSIAPWDYHKIRMGLGKGSGQESPLSRSFFEKAKDLFQ